jgi:hypothetical protein
MRNLYKPESDAGVIIELLLARLQLSFGPNIKFITTKINNTYIVAGFVCLAVDDNFDTCFQNCRYYLRRSGKLDGLVARFVQHLFLFHGH